jgi:methionyl-tRNA formyltransferase
MKPSVIFFGSKPGSVVALEILLDLSWDVKYVVVTKTQVYNWINSITLEQFAKSRGLNVIIQKDLPKGLKTDFVISYMYRNLVNPSSIELAKNAALNFHAAPLPEFGGWAFYNLAILEEVEEYGCTCHYMDDNFDTGPILKVSKFKVDIKNETAYSLERKAQAEMIKLFIDFCKMAESNQKLPLECQDKNKMRYLKREEFENLKNIPENADGYTIDKYARAFWYPPYECAKLKFNDSTIEIVPSIAKIQVAELLHYDDLKFLQEVRKKYK